MEKPNLKNDTLISCPKCQKSFTLSYIKENTHSSHTGGIYCPNCFCKLDINKPKSQKVKATKKKIPNNVRNPTIQLKPTEKYKLPYSLDKKRQAKHAWILVISTIAIAALLSVFSENTGKNSNNNPNINRADNSINQNSNTPKFYKFKSTETDVEEPNNSGYTNAEICYHTFDYENNEVIFEGTNSNGERTKIVYPIKSTYVDGLTHVIVVKNKGMNEIWFSPAVNNLGYDLMDGTRLACYNITKIK